MKHYLQVTEITPGMRRAADTLQNTVQQGAAPYYKKRRNPLMNQRVAVFRPGMAHLPLCHRAERTGLSGGSPVAIHHLQQRLTGQRLMSFTRLNPYYRRLLLWQDVALQKRYKLNPMQSTHTTTGRAISAR